MPGNETLARKPNLYGRWLATLDALSVQFLVLDTRRDRELLAAARSHPAWAVDFEDEEAVLFTHVVAKYPTSNLEPWPKPS